MQTDGTYNYTYDNEGNVTRRTKISDNTVTDYTWDYRNRLASVTDKVSATGATLKKVEYTYDAFDQRTAKRLDNAGNGTWELYKVFVWADGQEVQRWVDTDGATATQKLRLSRGIAPSPCPIGHPSPPLGRGSSSEWLRTGSKF